MGGGGFQYANLKPGESFTKTFHLTAGPCQGTGALCGRWHLFFGKYSTNYITVHSDPLTVTVLPRTAQEMDAYIAI